MLSPFASINTHFVRILTTLKYLSFVHAMYNPNSCSAGPAANISRYAQGQESQANTSSEQDSAPNKIINRRLYGEVTAGLVQRITITSYSAPSSAPSSGTQQPLNLLAAPFNGTASSPLGHNSLATPLVPSTLLRPQQILRPLNPRASLSVPSASSGLRQTPDRLNTKTMPFVPSPVLGPYSTRQAGLLDLVRAPRLGSTIPRKETLTL